MAKKGKRKGTSRRRSPRGINLKTALFAYANLAVATRAATNVSPIQFFTEGYVGDTGAAFGNPHGTKITLKELLSGSHLGPMFASDQAQTYLGSGAIAGSEPIMTTLKNNLTTNAIPAIGALIGLKVADVLITKLGVSKNFNSVVKSIGMKGTVRM